MDNRKQYPNACAACKEQRRKCTKDCVLAPYFPANKPKRFESVRKVFGVRNFLKFLEQAPMSHTTQAAEAMIYEAEVRLRDPVRGLTGEVVSLCNQILKLHNELEEVKKELSNYRPPEALLPVFPSQPKTYSNLHLQHNKELGNVVKELSNKMSLEAMPPGFQFQPQPFFNPQFQHNVPPMLGTSTGNWQSGNSVIRDILRAFESSQQHQITQRPQHQQQIFEDQQHVEDVAVQREPQGIFRAFDLNQQLQIAEHPQNQQQILEGQQHVVDVAVDREQQHIIRAPHHEDTQVEKRVKQSQQNQHHQNFEDEEVTSNIGPSH